MVKLVWEVERALGKISYDLTEKMKKSRELSCSLFVAKYIKTREIIFIEKNVYSLILCYDLVTKYWKNGR